MRRFVEGVDRGQNTLFPECLEDWIGEENPVRVIEVFVDELDLAELGFSGVDPEATDRPSYHPSVLLKLYIYGYLNRVRSSCRLGGTMPAPWTWPHASPASALIGLQRGSGIEAAEISLGAILSLVSAPDPVC